MTTTAQQYGRFCVPMNIRSDEIHDILAGWNAGRAGRPLEPGAPFLAQWAHACAVEAS